MNFFSTRDKEHIHSHAWTHLYNFMCGDNDRSSTKKYEAKKNCPIDDDEGLRFITFRVHHMTMVKSKETCTPINNNSNSIAEQHQIVKFFFSSLSLDIFLFFFFLYNEDIDDDQSIGCMYTHCVVCFEKDFFFCTLAESFWKEGCILYFYFDYLVS